jgi:hypothetical protein
MDVFVRDGTKMVLTSIDGKPYPLPGVDKRLIAFELFTLMMELMSQPQSPSVTWGSAWAPRLSNEVGMG